MIYNEFLSLNIVKPVLKATKLPEADQFPSTDFFKSDNGLLLRDFNVFAKFGDSPELRDKLREYMSVHDNQSPDDKTVQRHMERLSLADILSNIDSRISQLEAEQSIPAETE